MSKHADVAKIVTDQIVAALEEGHHPWHPRHNHQPLSQPLRHDGTPYRGVNVLLLWCAGAVAGYSSPHWMTYRQAAEYGGQVRKGEKSTPVVFYKEVTKGEGEAAETFRLLRYYSVFNADQVEGLPDRFAVKEPGAINPDQQHAEFDDFFAALLPFNPIGSKRAPCYSPETDAIHMPAFGHFTSAAAYYQVAAHEVVHWTAGPYPGRLERECATNYASDLKARAKEELVAEVGAAMLCAVLGVPSEPREDHAGYVASWLKLLRDDRRQLLSAAAMAQAAVDFATARVEETRSRRGNRAEAA